MLGGWSTSKVDRVKGAQIPQMLKCYGCNKTRPQPAFSGSQLTRLKEKVAFKGRDAIDTHPLRCRQCTGGEAPVDILCIRCDKRKPVDEFFKVQRRKLDTAMCINCVSDGQLSRPYDDNEMKQRENDYAFLARDDDESTVVGSVAGGVVLRNCQNTEGDQLTESGTMYSRPSVPSLYSQTVDEGTSYDFDKEESVAGGVYIEDVRSLHEGSSTGYGSSQVGTISGPRAATDEYAWQLNQRQPRAQPNPKIGKWAKIRAHDPYRTAREMRIPERDSGEQDDCRSGFSGSVAPSSSFY